MNVGVPFSYKLPGVEDNTGTPPFVFSIEGVEIPDGVAFNPDTQMLEGTPTTEQAEAEGEYVVIDSAWPQRTDRIPLRMVVFADTNPALAPISDKVFIVGIQDSITLAINGGNKPFKFTIKPGRSGVVVPDWLGVSERPTGGYGLGGKATAVLPATPLILEVEDADGDKSTQNFSISVLANEPPEVTDIGDSFNHFNRLVRTVGSLRENQTLRLLVFTRDPEGQSRSFVWEGATRVSTNLTSPHYPGWIGSVAVFGPAAIGTHEVSVTVSDGVHSIKRTTNVGVIGPQTTFEYRYRLSNSNTAAPSFAGVEFRNWSTRSSLRTTATMRYLWRLSRSRIDNGPWTAWGNAEVIATWVDPGEVKGPYYIQQVGAPATPAGNLVGGIPRGYSTTRPVHSDDTPTWITYARRLPNSVDFNYDKPTELVAPPAPTARFYSGSEPISRLESLSLEAGKTFRPYLIVWPTSGDGFDDLEISWENGHDLGYVRRGSPAFGGVHYIFRGLIGPFAAGAYIVTATVVGSERGATTAQTQVNVSPKDGPNRAPRVLQFHVLGMSADDQGRYPIQIGETASLQLVSIEDDGDGQVVTWHGATSTDRGVAQSGSPPIVADFRAEFSAETAGTHEVYAEVWDGQTTTATAKIIFVVS